MLLGQILGREKRHGFKSFFEPKKLGLATLILNALKTEIFFRKIRFVMGIRLFLCRKAPKELKMEKRLTEKLSEQEKPILKYI